MAAPSATAPPPRIHGVTILGATGSIGTQAIDIVRRHPDRFLVTGLAASGRDLALLARQALTTGAPLVAIADEQAAAAFPDALRAAAEAANVRVPIVEVLAGADAATELARIPTGVVLNGLAGAVGLPPTVAALEAGSVLALANKESLIIGGPVVKRLARPDQIVPVDSEHSALAQALRGGAAHEVRRLILTASGGPFRGMTRHELDSVTPDRALAHPTWRMGPLVTVNSATLVNKGLELIEAHLLFDVPFEALEVVVHPQSIVHSMVEFTDGSTLLQASPPDMRLPIALGLAWPDRVPDAIPACDWTDLATWTFEPVDHETFPAVRLASRVGEAGGVLPAIFNAADEVAVEAFLAGALPFRGIVETIERVVGEYDGHLDGNELSVRDVLAADSEGRQRAREAITSRR